MRFSYLGNNFSIQDCDPALISKGQIIVTREKQGQECLVSSFFPKDGHTLQDCAVQFLSDYGFFIDGYFPDNVIFS